MSETTNRIRGLVSELKHKVDELDSLMYDLDQEARVQTDDLPGLVGELAIADLTYNDARVRKDKAVRDQIESMVHSAISLVKGSDTKVEVVYSAYKFDDNDVPINNLEDRAWDGPGVIIEEGDDFFGNGETWESRILESPKMIDVVVEANSMIKATEDYHHQFFEGVNKTGKTVIRDYCGEEREIPVYELIMGS